MEKITVEEVKGFKVFNPDWTCRGFQYEVGKTFEEDIIPKCCESGFHFCTKASDCFRYYDFNPDNKVAEVEAIGVIDTQDDDSKCCTNKIHIIRELTWNEVLELVNLGKGCTGLCNTGDYNTGNWNTGNRNTGDYNTGNRNTGNWNTGNRNTGNWNTGNRNTGNSNTGNNNTGNRNTGNSNTGYYNTGYYNTGDYNTGDYNKSSFNTGCFMTEEPQIMMFNKPTNWTYRKWLDSEARYLLNCIDKNIVKWVCESDMTYEEKTDNPTYKTTGGYLKVLDESECGQVWWNELSDSNRDIIRALPNFDSAIFEQITGIKVE